MLWTWLISTKSINGKPTLLLLTNANMYIFMQPGRIANGIESFDRRVVLPRIDCHQYRYFKRSSHNFKSTIHTTSFHLVASPRCILVISIVCSQRTPTCSRLHTFWVLQLWLQPAPTTRNLSKVRCGSRR